MECEESVVEDFLLDSEKQLKLVNSFIQKGLEIFRDNSLALPRDFKVTEEQSLLTAKWVNRQQLNQVEQCHQRSQS